MYRIKIVLLLSIIYCSYALNGQVDSTSTDSKFKNAEEVYNHYAVKSIAEYTLAYMNHNCKSRNCNEVEEIGKEKLLEQLEEINDSTLIFVGEILEGWQWTNTKDQFFQKLKSKFDNKVELNIDFFLISDDFDQIQTLVGLRNKLIEDYKDELKELNSVNSSVRNEHVDAKATASSEVPAPESFKGESPSPREVRESKLNINSAYLYILLFGLILGLFTCLFIYRLRGASMLEGKNAKDIPLFFGLIHEIDEIQKALIVAKQSTSSNNQQNQIEVLKKENGTFKEEIQQLEKENKDLKHELETLSVKQNTPSNASFGNTEGNTSFKPRIRKSLYFSMPSENGTFHVDHKFLENDGSRYYRIDFEESSSKGDIYFLNGERDLRAINRKSKVLLPVCSILDEVSNPSNISFIEKGTVVLENDKWVIDPENKIKIKLN